MTCKDCINYKLCQEVNSLPCRDEFAWYRYESGCPYFKDKSKIIELPCKVGDVIYHFKDIYSRNGKRKKYEKTIIEHLIVDSFVIGDSGKPQINTCMIDRNEW